MGLFLSPVQQNNIFLKLLKVLIKLKSFMKYSFLLVQIILQNLKINTANLLGLTKLWVGSPTC